LGIGFRNRVFNIKNLKPIIPKKIKALILTNMFNSFDQGKN
jgi:hypothetical protein